MIGIILKNIIDKSGKSTEEVAKMMGITKQQLYALYKQPSVTTSMVQRISEALNQEITITFAPNSQDTRPISQVNEDQGEYAKPNITDKYAQCLENNNLLLTELRQCKQELEAIKKQGDKVKERIK